VDQNGKKRKERQPINLRVIMATNHSLMNATTQIEQTKSFFGRKLDEPTAH
jgi:hypothetical protein